MQAATSSKDGLALEDLEHIGTLGVGTFSRVKMVKIKGTTETYALKIMKKKVIEIRKQKEHVMNEKHIMACVSTCCSHRYPLFCLSYFVSRVSKVGPAAAHRGSSRTERGMRCNTASRAVQPPHKTPAPCGYVWFSLTIAGR